MPSDSQIGVEDVPPPVAQRKIRAALDALEYPLRTSSLIVSIFGDAVAPRGGSVWLGTLTEILGVFGISPGSVRTAMSRLAADGWVERMRDGRESHFRLTARAEQEFGPPSQTIYSLGAKPWNGEWRIAVLIEPDEQSRRALRSALRTVGYGQIGPNVFIKPHYGKPSAHEREGVLLLTGAKSIGDADAEPLVENAWPLESICSGYRQLIRAFEPIEAAIAEDKPVSDLEALALRIFVVHELRRVVLKDPDLPTSLLPEDWPATEVREQAAEIWRALVEPSERWLDHHGRCGAGPLPPLTEGFALRFAKPAKPRS